MKNLFSLKDIKHTEHNIFKLFDNDWLLLTAGNKTNFNPMTISWGTMGILWNRPVVICFVRPQRYTLQLIQQNGIFTLSAFPPTMKKVLNLCGSVSGRDVNKVSEAGITPMDTPRGGIAFEEAVMYVECQKTYHDQIKKDSFTDSSLISTFYPASDFHHLFIGEITGWYEKSL